MPHKLLAEMIPILAGRVSLVTFRGIARVLAEAPTVHLAAQVSMCLPALVEQLAPLLPRRSHAKVRLLEVSRFFFQQGSSWFTVRAFASYLGLDRKTAWEYLRLFLHSGLLHHNGAASSAARYRLAALPADPQ